VQGFALSRTLQIRSRNSKPNYKVLNCVYYVLSFEMSINTDHDTGKHCYLPINCKVFAATTTA